NHIWFYEGDLAAARHWMRRVAELDPGLVGYALSGCRLLLDLRQLDAARTCVEGFASRAPDAPAVLLTSGLVALSEGRNQVARDTLQAMLENHAEAEPFLTGLATQALMLAGDDEGALAHFRSRLPGLFQPDSEFPDRDVSLVVDAGTLMMRSDPVVGRPILEAALRRMETLDRIRGGDAYRWHDIYARAALGQEAQAVAALREAVDSGLRWHNWMIDHRPELDPIRDHPDFQAAMADLLADIERQREAMPMDAAP
ncbi:MAG: hypothetical protein R3200_17625, partial [Xanthomonadales bacterium]|nr:hypothetical protein [Xanthomonadales bacterium]